MSAFDSGAVRDVAPSGLTLGENGHACLTAEGLGDSLLALFDRLFQGIEEGDLRQGLRAILEDARRLGRRELVVDTFVLAFSARWCRGGKGAKLPFYQCMKMLYEDFPGVVLKLLPLVPQFGYWKDYLLLLQEVNEYPVKGVDYVPLSTEVWRLYAEQLEKDYALLTASRAAGEKPALSYAGKYAPREKKQFAKSLHAVRELALRMFPPLESDLVVIGASMEQEKKQGDPKPNKKRYREVVSALSTALDVPEVKMCARRYASINMAAVPSRCMKAQSKAFANDLKDSPHTVSQGITGNRHPEDEDRVTARKHLVDTLMSKGVKGGQVYPDEFVGDILDGMVRSVMGRQVVNAQWTSMREGIAQMVSERIALAAGAGGAGAGALGKLVPLCDVSGSMSGWPMDVSIGLSILCSELTHAAFKDLVLCFSAEAQWHDLSGCTDIVEKVRKLREAPWDMNTDFEKAMQRVLKVVLDNDLRQEDVPNLLVISDMQFDQANSGARWNTAYENIEAMFRDAGMSKYGTPLTPPTIVFWNVDASIGFPAASDQKGVVMLSGFSPALLKFVLSGELEREEDVKGEKGKVVEGRDSDEEDGEPPAKRARRQVTPAEAMQTALHEDAYAPIRAILEACSAEELGVSPTPLARAYTRRVRSQGGRGGRGGGGCDRGGRGLGGRR
jgi:hypothetical protein